MVNKVILVGRLGKDPETRATATGTTVVNFSLATDESFKDKSGDKVQKTEWHRIVVWGKLGEICAKYLTKGSLVYIDGKLQTRQWEDKDGNKRSTTEISASNMRMIGGDRKEQGPDSQAPTTSGGGGGYAGDGGFPEDDVPF